jgi:hypothetical protein
LIPFFITLNVPLVCAWQIITLVDFARRLIASLNSHEAERRGRRSAQTPASPSSLRTS